MKKKFVSFAAAAAMACSAMAAQDKNSFRNAPSVPEIVVDPNGTLHSGPRTIPPPTLASPEAKAAYAKQFIHELNAVNAKRALGEEGFAARMAAAKDTALRMYPVTAAEEKMAGVPVTIYTPQDLAAANRNRIVMEFEIDSEAIQVAHFGHIKTVSVHYRGGGPSVAGDEDIVAVYRELLKSRRPKDIGMFGTSGGCTLAATTLVWLPQLRLPEPGAVGLLTCSGGSNPGDTRITNNGLDVTLSTIITGRPPVGGAVRAAAPRKPGEPPATALDGEIPRGYPPAFLLSGTRDMCLSQTVLLHRRLRQAGVDADLNVFEGMWHAFHGDPELPESRDAMTALAKFFDSRLGR